MLRQAWGTTNARTLPLSATGSAGMEAAFVNTVHPGDVVVVAVNGLFGQRMCDVAARCGAEVVAGRARVGPAGRRATRARRRTPRRRSSPPCTPRPPPACAPTSPRWARARATRCCSSTPSPASPASSCAPTTGAIDIGYAGTQKCLGVAPGPRAVHDQRPRVRAPGREAAVVVPRPRPARRLRRRGVRVRRPDLPPHRPVRDGREPARRPDADPRGGPGRGLGAARRRPAAQLQDGLEEMGLELFAAEGPPAARADHGQGARRRRLGRRTPLPARAATTSRSAPEPARTPRACGGSA